MPTYCYKCDNCNDEFEIKQSFADKPLKKCKVCKKHKLNKVLFVPYVAIKLGDSDLRTIDHVGRRNFEKDEKLGIIAERGEKDKERKELEARNTPLPCGRARVPKPTKKPWWRESNKVDTSLADLNDTKKNEYILKGKK